MFRAKNGKNPALSLTWGFTARGSGSRVRNDSKAALGALRPSRGVSQSHPVGGLTASPRAKPSNPEGAADRMNRKPSQTGRLCGDSRAGSKKERQQGAEALRHREKRAGDSRLSCCSRADEEIACISGPLCRARCLCLLPPSTYARFCVN